MQADIDVGTAEVHLFYYVVAVALPNIQEKLCEKLFCLLCSSMLRGILCDSVSVL